MPRENPFQAPLSSDSSGANPEREPLVYCRAATRRRILAVALWQRYTWMILLVALGIILCFLFFTDQSGDRKYTHSDHGSFQAALFVGPLFFVLHGFYKLAESLQVRFPVPLTMLLLTGVGLLLIPYYSYRATQFLRSFGFEVAWYGASPGRLDKLIGVTPDD